jgi:RHS repeat-associated protein
MRRYLISIAAVFLLPLCIFAQTGVPPFASFSQNQFAMINNGNLNGIFVIPIMSSPGRGISVNLNAAYNSQVWAPEFNGGGALAWTPIAGWILNSPIGSVTYTATTTGGSCGRLGQGYTQTTIFTSYVYTDPLGTPHPFVNTPFVRQVYSSCTDQTTYSGNYFGNAKDESGYYAYISNPAVSIVPTITSKSGVIVSTSAMTMTDRNGNVISGAYNGSYEIDWTDSAGRLALKVIWSNTNTFYKYEFLDPTGVYRTTTVNLAAVNVKTNFGCSNIIEYSAGNYLPTSIVLPNNQTYTFTYEPTPGNSGYYTGRVQRVTLPTGGYYEYDYTGSNDGINCADGSTLGINQVVSDGTNTATWKYSRTTNGTTTITTPQLADTPNAHDTVYSFTGSQATQVKIYKESPGVNVLRTINTTWATNGTPATQVTILEDGSTQSEVDTTYDSNGLLDSVSEYNSGLGSRGSLLRTTTYTYQTSVNYTGLNIIDLVLSQQIQDGSGNLQYRQDITYDATSGDNQSCPTGIAQHNDTSFGCTFYYRGNPTSVTTYQQPATQGGGITKNLTYDFFGNLRTAQLNCCQNKTWGYSSASTTQNYSLPDSVTSGSGPSLKTTYTYYLPTGQVNTATDPNGLVTTFSYDYLRRPIQVSQTNGPGISMSYDDVHFTSTTKTSVDSSKSVQQISALDTLGRSNLTTTEDASNNIYSNVTTKYDLGGQAYQSSNPYTGTPSYWTTTAFDVLGRPTSITLPDASVTNLTYSTNTTTAKDPAGNQRESVVDGVGRLSSVYEPDPTNNNSLTLQTSYTYNVLDELTQIAQSSQTRSYVYDALGRLNSATTPEAGTLCFGTVSSGSCQSNGYDSYNNLLYRTDARGVIASYGYDALNRLTSVSYNVSGATGVPATASLGFIYGNDSSCNSAHGAGCIGQLITLNDGVGSENYTYNALEQLTQLQKVINGSTYATSYAYNLAAQLTQITYPSGRVVQQSVDPIGRLCEIAPSTTGCGTASNPYATGYAYGTASQVTGFKYGNGLYASYGFSADRLQLNCLDYSTTNRSGACTHDGTTKFGLSYSYPSPPGNNGLFSGITDSADAGRSATYTYDSLYRLVSAVTGGSTNYPAWGLSETYDRYGNRSAQSIKSGCTGITCPTNSVTPSATTNRLGSPYTYDSGGNMTYDGLNALIYDAENHTTSASGTSAGAYVYDGNGLRVQKCLPACGGSNPNTVYVFSGSKVIAEYDNGAGVTSPSREYVYSGAALLAKIDSSGTKYYHKDQLSNRLVTDSSGNTLEQLGTFPFGESWYNASSDKLLFTTYERDSESGNDYAQARYNVSRLGRFSSPDPIAGSSSDPQSLNRYSYVRNMPVSIADPSGTCPPTVQNRDTGATQSSESGGGPSEPSGDAADPMPQGWGNPCGGGNPWYPGWGGWGGGAGGLDGGYNGDDSGFGVGSPVGVSPGDPFSMIGAALTPTGGHWVSGDCAIQGGDGCLLGTQEWVDDYDNSWLLGLFGGNNSGIALAKSLLAQIAKGGFALNPKCRAFLQAYIDEQHLNISVDALVAQIKATAADAESYVYDGPSSAVPVTPASFPGYSGSTVGDTFTSNSSQQSLSQYDGSAIYIRAGDWQSFLGVSSSYNGSYGSGTLLHEIIHKKSVGGGMIGHDPMDAALSSVVQGTLAVGMGHNKESDLLGQLCF